MASDESTLTDTERLPRAWRTIWQAETEIPQFALSFSISEKRSAKYRALFGTETLICSEDALRQSRWILHSFTTRAGWPRKTNETIRQKVPESAERNRHLPIQAKGSEQFLRLRMEFSESAPDADRPVRILQ
jgi:hypothetical protein